MLIDPPIPPQYGSVKVYQVIGSVIGTQHIFTEIQTGPCSGEVLQGFDEYWQARTPAEIWDILKDNLICFDDNGLFFQSESNNVNNHAYV